MDKILICGPRGVGKSTLIRRLTALYPGPVSGFVTKRETVADGEGLFPIYIHPAACPESRRQYGPENLIGRCDRRRSVRCTPAFDDWGPRLLEGPGLLLMDELGFLERDAHRFQEAVLAALRGDQPVLAAVKTGTTRFAGGAGRPRRPGAVYHPGEPGGAVPPAEAGPCTGRIITKNSGRQSPPLFFILLLLCQSMVRVKLMPLFCICTSSRTRSPRI